MRAVVQRVVRAEVRIEGEPIPVEAPGDEPWRGPRRIGTGLMVLLGAGQDDTEADVVWMAEKVLALRIFPDEAGLMNRSLVDVGGGLLVVSQFTLYGDCRKGRRPSFIGALAPGPAEQLYERFLTVSRASGLHVGSGRFGADMKVELVNDGPVTLLLDSKRLF